ncbi:small GTPase rabE [Pelomyxa schiedti]|nr:small GTPase rabE [Pelomyxa schiedti]
MKEVLVVPCEDPLTTTFTPEILRTMGGWFRCHPTDGRWWVWCNGTVMVIEDLLLCPGEDQLEKSFSGSGRSKAAFEVIGGVGECLGDVKPGRCLHSIVCGRPGEAILVFNNRASELPTYLVTINLSQTRYFSSLVMKKTSSGGDYYTLVLQEGQTGPQSMAPIVEIDLDTGEAIVPLVTKVGGKVITVFVRNKKEATHAMLTTTIEGGIKEIVCKVLVIGASGAGKTSLIKRSVHGVFSTAYKTTIGVDFLLKKVDLDNAQVKMQLWDIAGQELFASLTRVYYRSAVAAFIVFDITDLQSFQSVMSWKQDLEEKCPTVGDVKMPVILLANKCDLPRESHCVSVEQVAKFAAENGFLAWFETSAKENTGIEQALRRLATELSLMKPPEQAPAPTPTRNYVAEKHKNF